MRRHLSTILFFILSIFTYGQYYSSGNEQTVTSWRQIKTDHFQVIYPKNCDSLAQEVTKKLEYIYSFCCKSLNHEPKKISVILHNHSNISNAAVYWCPSQMDMYTSAGQTQHSQEWFENITLHEFRHVVQTDKLNQGLTKILYFLLGEQAVGGVSGLYIPQWVFEGDAVCTETALSMTGRGRQADFSMPLRAQTYEKGVYPYSKAYFGSFRDFVPSYYEMGYFFLANVRKQYGHGYEAEMLDRAGSHPLSIRPINYVSKRKTGLSRRDLYATIFEQQQNEWMLKHDREIQTKFEPITKKQSVFTNYINGIQLNDTTYYVERNGIDKISQLIQITNGKERVVSNISFKPSEDRIQSNGKTIVWEETNYNIRWEMKQNSFVYLYDTERNKQSKIKTKRHVFAPAISPSNERIVTAETNEIQKNLLTIFDKETKKVIKEIPSQNNDAVENPSWNENGSKIVYIGLNSQGKRLVEYDIVNETFEEIIPYTYEDLQHPIYWHEYIIYASSYSGVDNLYAINKQTKDISRITVADFGCKFPSTKDSTLIYSNYTSDGYQLVKIHLNPAAWHSINVVKKDNYNLAQMLTNQEGGAVDFSQIPDSTYESKYYSKILHTFNIHSWMPFCLNYNGSNIDDRGLGFQVISQNKLQTTFTTVGYRKNRIDGKQYSFAKVTYKGLFPVFELEYQNGNHAYSIQDSPSDTITYSFDDIYGRIYFPLNFSSKSYLRYVILSSQFQYTKQKIEDWTQGLQITDKAFDANIFAHTLTIANLRQQATREINPRFGQLFKIGYEYSSPSLKDFHKCDSTVYSPYYFAELTLYFPGILRDHSFNMYGAVEGYKNLRKEKVNRQISIPRGFIDSVDFEEQLYSFQFNYFFPFGYPDVEWKDILYLKRISCNLFTDVAIAPKTNNNYFSYGAEFIANLHLFNFIAPFNAGLRFSVMPQKQINFIEFIFLTDFDSL